MTVRRPTLSSSSSRKQKTTLSNSRHFTCTRLIKTCCPNPNPATPCYNSPIVAISKKTSTSTSTWTTIHSLPDDILYDILSRVPLPSLPSVSSVCRRWSHLLESHSFTLFRRLQCRLHPTIFAFSFSNSTSSSSSSSFSTLRPYVDNSWNVIVSSQLSRLPGIPHARVTALGGRKVFVITRVGCCFLYDTWTGVVQPRPRSGPIHPRKRFAVASINGKVYVAGGSASTSALEEYNPDTNEWSVVSNAPRKRYGCIGASVDNVFFIIGGLKIGGASDTRAAVSGAEARVYGGSMEVYDTAARGWLRSRTVPGGGCVVAACGANGYLYVLASHAVELSFWRFNARRKRGSFGEWSRLRGPPVSGLGGRVKYSLVGVEDKVVVLIQVIVGCIDELLSRRNARNVGCNKDGIVLIFDCVTQEWCRGPDLPDFVRKAECVSVDC